MITPVRGNILQAETEALVNTVNCVGVMGRGIAAQFKKAFPKNFKEYKRMCDRKEIHPGAMFTYDRSVLDGSQRYVINFPTKRHWRAKSKLEDIQSGLTALVQEVHRRSIRSIAIPPLGCGLGGLDWPTVRNLIEQAFAEHSEVNVLLYEPKGAPEASAMINRTRRPNMTHGRAALLVLMRRYLAGLMDISISLLEIHKLMYFMQESGEDLRLKFSKRAFGPYASNLGHVLSHIEGHFVSGYGDGGNEPGKLIEPMESAVEEANKYLEAPQHESTRLHFERIAKLIDGFEEPYGMELLATVHWVAHHENATSVEQAIEAIHSWNERKSSIDPRHIQIAWKRLQDEAWLS